ncbi:MAG: M20/M25/M40 family metallo-hydrolase [Leptospira sp.]|nr:M20/M25/M40 family metallo-hydrolase [Leptospira sp.]
MKKRNILLLLAMGLTLCKSEPKDEKAEFLKKEKEQLTKLYQSLNEGSQAYSELEKMSSLGNRMTATEQGTKAEEIIFEKLKEYGYEPRFHSFPINIWTRQNASLRIQIGGKTEDFNTLSFAYTPKDSHIKGRIIDVGNGLPEDFKKHAKDIKGNIVLVNLHVLDIKNYKGGNPHRSTRVLSAIAKGAIGVIMVNKFFGEILATGTVAKDDKLVKVPAICISFRDGQRIRDAIQSGDDLIANLQIQNNQEMAEARNVIATLPGLDPLGKKVVLGGHLDTWDVSSGAFDNGIGSFSILDIARAMKESGVTPHRNVEFVFWMGEEQGLIGSKAYIKDQMESGKLDEIYYYINIDLDGNPKGLNTQGWDSAISTIKEMGNRVKGFHKPYKNVIVNRPTDSSDNVPFAVAGIPVLRMLRDIKEEKLKYYHSNKDNFYLIEEDDIKNSAIVMGMMTFLIANARDWDIKRLNVEETKKFLTERNKHWILTEANHWKLRQTLESGKPGGSIEKK